MTSGSAYNTGQQQEETRTIFTSEIELTLDINIVIPTSTGLPAQKHK